MKSNTGRCLRQSIVLMLLLLPLALLPQTRDDERWVEKTIERLNSEIRQMGMDWRADETGMSRLSPQERRLRLGALTPETGEATFHTFELTALPTQLDWRNIGGQSWLTAIRDQGSCGSCWAFATLAAIESIHKIEQNDPAKEIDLSEQHLVSCSGAGDCVGGYSKLAADYIQRTGVPTELCYPYQNQFTACSPCSNWNKSAARIAGVEWVSTSTSNNAAIINALQDAPVVTWMQIYSDFYHYRSGIYEKTASATLEGGHNVLIVGYDSSQRYWICKNSWDSDWGEEGYFRIRWDQTGIGRWTMRIWGVSTNNHPPVLSHVGNRVVKEGEELSFQLSASDSDNNPLTYACVNPPADIRFDTRSGLFTWTPSYTQSGVYPLVFQVSDGLAHDSEAITITVINVKKGRGRL